MTRRRLAGSVAALVFLPVILVVAGAQAVLGGRFDNDFFAMVLIAGSVAALLAYVAARVVLHAEVSTPLQAIAERAQAFSDGQVRSGRLLEPTGTVEMDRLIDAFNALFARVTDYVEDLEQGRLEFRRSIERLGSVLASTHDRPAILNATVEAATAMSRAERGVLWVPRGTTFVARLVHPASGTILVPLERGKGLAGWAGHFDQPRITDRRDDLHPGEPEGSTAMAVPIHSGGRLFGVLAVYGRRDNQPFGEDDLASLRTLAGQAESAIENTYLHEEASRLSLTDGLTATWNRRHFDLRLTEELDRAARFVEPFAVAMIDIDGFKTINDTYGHLAGDMVLVELARRLKEGTRRVDVVARYGGEEFALILPRTNGVGAAVIAENLREAVAAEPVQGDGYPIPLTVSIGVAAYPDDGADPRELLAAADRALYQAKSEGKNRVHLACPVYWE